MLPASVYRFDRRLRIKAGLLVCMALAVLSGCSSADAPARQPDGSVRRNASGEVKVAMASGRALTVDPDTPRGVFPRPTERMDQRRGEPMDARTAARMDEGARTDALVLFTAMRKARVLHALH